MKKSALVLLMLALSSCASVSNYVKFYDYYLNSKEFDTNDRISLYAFDTAGYLIIKRKDNSSVSFWIISSRHLKTGERSQTFCKDGVLLTLGEGNFMECVDRDDKNSKIVIYFRTINKVPMMTIVSFYSIL